MDRMNHKKDTPNPLQMKARENNVLKILDALAATNKPAESKAPMTPPMDSPMDKPMGPKSPTPMQSMQPQGAADMISPEVMASQSFDEQGEFVEPPVEDYWLQVLEKINAEDPYKSGPDWRDEFIGYSKKARARIRAMEEELRSRQGGSGIGSPR